MAKVPIEIIRVGGHDMETLDSAIALANSDQSEFEFLYVSDDISKAMSMLTFDKAIVAEFMDQMESARQSIRGYHPFLIAITDAHLDGAKYTNLFGSHRGEKGVAVITTAMVADVILPKDRMSAYFLYYLARYALSFMSPTHRNHEDSRGCVFDRKVLKADIVKSMKDRALCDQCRQSLIDGDGCLSPSQFQALQNLFALSGRILAEGINPSGKQRIFIGSSTEGLVFANKLQELLAIDFSIIVWNQGTVFGLGSSTLEALEAAVLEYYAAVFVFTPDDQLHSRGETKPVARDNVLFELGMFIGKLGRGHAFAVHPGNRGIALPSDLAGITTAPYDPDETNLDAALGPVANKIRTAVKEA